MDGDLAKQPARSLPQPFDGRSCSSNCVWEAAVAAVTAGTACGSANSPSPARPLMKSSPRPGRGVQGGTAPVPGRRLREPQIFRRRWPLSQGDVAIDLIELNGLDAMPVRGASLIGATTALQQYLGCVADYYHFVLVHYFIQEGNDSALIIALALALDPLSHSYRISDEDRFDESKPVEAIERNDRVVGLAHSD